MSSRISKVNWMAVSFCAAENSMGFYAPQEAARTLAETIDLARQAQVQVLSAGKL